MPTRYIDAAHVKMAAAKKALEECQASQPRDLERERKLFRELCTATDEYVAAVDQYIERTKANNLSSSSAV